MISFLGRQENMKKIIATLLFFVLIICIWAPSTSIANIIDDNWWDSEWEYRKEITINHEMVSSNLKNFPILFHCISSNFSYHAQPDGDDFVFVSIDRLKQYNHEIENYDRSTGELIAWVNITNIFSTEDTSLYIYYGNPNCGNQENIAGTWNSDFVGVWHCNNNIYDIYNDIKDSTVYNNDGTSKNMEIEDLVNGKISKAINFGGIDEKVLVYNSESSSLDLIDYLTLECWWKASDLDDSYNTLMGKTSSAGAWQYEYRLKDTYELKNRYSFLTYGGDHTDNISLSIDTWYYATVTYDPSDISLYNNGEISIVHESTEIISTYGDFGFGAAGEYGNFFKGIIDEVRVSKLARSEDWVKTSYNTMKNPEEFLSVGKEESKPFENTPPNKPVIEGPNSGKPGIEYEYSFRATDPDEDAIMFLIDWGDDSTEWTEFGDSGMEITLRHTWENEDKYTIKAKTIDIHDSESDWTEYELVIPRYRVIHKNDNQDDHNWPYFLFGRIRNFEIIEYEEEKFLMGKAVHVRGVISNLFSNYPNLPLPVIWIWQDFCIPFDGAKLIKIIGPNPLGNYFLITKGVLGFP
jgi:hypothetical protein